MILITGGAGFIGSHLTEELLNHGEKIIVIDDLSTGKLENIPKHENLTFIKENIADKNTIKNLFDSYPIKTVYHLAAIASVQKSIEQPEETHKTNFDATLFLLEKSKNHGVNKFVFASSAAVYGDLPELPKREDMPVKPLTPYGVDKYASERYVLNSSHLYNLNATALRFFNVYGERQDPSSPYSGVISIFIDRTIKHLNGEKTEIIIYGNGKQTRDFIYVKDIVKALLIAAQSPKSNGKVFNVGTGKETSLLQLLETIKEITGSIPPVRFAPPRKGDIKRSYADISKIRNLGFQPRYSLKEGLNKLISWELQNQKR